MKQHSLPEKWKTKQNETDPLSPLQSLGNNPLSLKDDLESYSERLIMMVSLLDTLGQPWEGQSKMDTFTEIL